MPAEAALVLEFPPAASAADVPGLPPLPHPAMAGVLEKNCLQPLRPPLLIAQEILGRSVLFSTGNRLLAALTFRPHEPALLLLDVAEQGTDLHTALATWQQAEQGRRLVAHQFRQETIWVCGTDRTGNLLAFAERDGWLLFSPQTTLVEDALASGSEVGSRYFREAVKDGTLRAALCPALLAQRLPASTDAASRAWLNAAAEQVAWATFIWDGQVLHTELTAPGWLMRLPTWGPSSRSRMAEVLPAHTAALLLAGFGEGAHFLKKTEHPPEPLWADYVLPWWGNEAAIGLTQPVSEGLAQETFVVLAARDTALASAKLRAYGTRHGLLQAYDYQTFMVLHFAEDALLRPLLGEVRALVQPACAVLGDYVVFASNVPALERWIDAYLVGETLSANSDFLDMAQQLPATVSGRLYLRAGALPALAEAVFPDGQYGAVAHDLGTLGWMGWDLRAGEAGTLAATFSRSSGQTQGTATALGLAWRTSMGAAAATAPQVVCAPQAEGGLALLVQDARHELYALSRSGKVLWQRVLPGPLLGRVEELDFTGEGSCCYFFNTPDALWMLDEQGRDVRGFPLRLRSRAVNGASLMRTGEHRGFVFFVALENGNMQAFNYLGQPLAGWNPQIVGEAVAAPVLTAQHGGQDFVAVLTRSGRLLVYGAEGQLHFPAVQWRGPFAAPMGLMSSKDDVPAFVAFNEQGQGFFCDLRGRNGTLPVGVASSAGGMASAQQSAGEAGLHWATWEAGRLTYGGEKKGIWKPLGTAQGLARPSAIFFPAGGAVGVLHGRERQVSLFSPKGGESFPGTTPCCLLPLPAGRSLVVVGDGATVCGYVR